MRGAETATRLVAPVANGLVAIGARGRKLSRPVSRTAFLAGLQAGDALEIGPFDRPAIRGANVSYFDVLDRAGLRERAAQHGRSPDDVPEIHYVSANGNLSVVDRQFDTVLSSHAIEHQPDLIAHLQAVERLLRPGGRYYVIVPDKRFSFDHFLPLSTVEDVMAAHRDRRSVHTGAAVLVTRLETTHNSALRHWIGLHGRPGINTDEHSRIDAEKEAAAADRGEYVDVHAWFFSPERFREIMLGLHEAKATTLRVVDVHETGFAQLEFFAILEKPR